MQRLLLRMVVVVLLTGEGRLCAETSAENRESSCGTVERLLQASELCRQVISNDYIYVEAENSVPVSYDSALELFEVPDLLAVIQQAYAQALPRGKEPEFVVEQVSSNQYAYINRKGQRSEIYEVCRFMPNDNEVLLIYHTLGERFFGHFQSVSVINLFSGSRRELCYIVQVYAYPENSAPRFFARHLGLVEWYFKRKTKDIIKLVRETGEQMGIESL